MKLLIEAIDIATHAHGKQVRKYSGFPYIQHPIRVMHRLYNFSSAVRHLYWIDEIELSAAVCHDVLEDTAVASQELTERLGKAVTSIVLELTKCETPGLPRHERKRLETERLSKVSNKAKLIKLLDRQDNLEEIIRFGAPEIWVSKYVSESRLLLDAIGSAYLPLKEEIMGIVGTIEVELARTEKDNNAERIIFAKNNINE